jgi:hypothetical protein
VATVTIGSSSYEVYSDLEYANEYLAADFTATAWRDETDEDQQKRALVSGARLLDRQQWPGEKEDEDQLEAWPRTGVSGVEDGEIPQAVIDANALLAKYIHEGSTLETSTTTANNTKRLKAGSAEIEYFFPLSNGTRLPLPVMELLAGLLGTAGSAITSAQSFDTDGCSNADDSYRPASGF